MGHPRTWILSPKILPKPVATAMTVQRKAIKDYFLKFDLNRDGKLNYRELTMAFRQLGAVAPGLRALFTILKVDENRDGYISEHELDELVEYAIERGFFSTISLLD